MTISAQLLPPPMPLSEAAELFEALRTVKDVVLGLCSQRRFESELGHYNEAGEFLDDLAELIGSALDRIAEVAEAAQPAQGSADYASRAAILIIDAFHGEGVSTAADRAIELFGRAEA